MIHVPRRYAFSLAGSLRQSSPSLRMIPNRRPATGHLIAMEITMARM